MTVAGIPELIAGIFILFAGITSAHLIPLLIILLTAGTISLIGGVCALKRRFWGLAVTGASFSIFCAVILGVPALWLILDAKKEFR